MNRNEIKERVILKLKDKDPAEVLTSAVVALFSAEEKFNEAANRTNNIHRLLSKDLAETATSVSRAISNILE